MEFFNKHKKGVITFLCWALPIILLLIYYAIRGVYPFGNGTILGGDLGTQYIDLFKYYKETILYDHTAFTYSFEKSLGGEMISTWGYYLMSPFNLILLFFPDHLFPVAMWILVILKVSSSSLAFGYVLQKKFNQSNLATVFFSFSYSLMSFVTAYMSNILWLDGLIWLPLIVYGIEMLVIQRKPFMYIMSLAILLVSNYYIGYMVCIFSVLYFLYVKYTQEHFGESKKDKIFFRDGLRFVSSSILAALLGAFSLIPTFYTLLAGKLDSVNPSFSMFWVHNPLDFVSRLLMGTFNYIPSLQYDYPNIFVGTVVSLGFFSFFFNENIKRKEKIGVAALSVFLLLSMSIGFLDLAWHAFALPNGLPHRYAFLFSFIMCYFGYQSFVSKVKYTSRGLKWFLGMYTLFAIYTLLFVDNLNLIGKTCAVVSIILCFILMLFYTLIKDHKESKLLLLFVMFEMMFNTAVNLLYLGYFEESVYQDVATQMGEVTEWFNENENPSDFYRLEKTFNRSHNDSFSFNYKGIQNFNSNLEKESARLFFDLGTYADSVSIDYYGGTLITDSFFGLDYYVELKESSSLYDNPSWITLNPRSDIHAYPKVAETKNFNIYKNPYALSIGFGVNNEFLANEYRNKKYLNLNNSLLSAIVNENINAFTKEKIHYYDERGEITNLDYVAIDDSDLSFTVGKEADGLHYVYLPTFGKENSRTSWSVKSTTILAESGALAFNSNVLLNVSGVKEYTLKFEKDDTISHLQPYFYTLNETALSDAIGKIKGNEFIVGSYTNSSIIGHTESTFDRETLMFTIPYSKDWKVRVDGKLVETKKAYDVFLAIDLGTGKHDVELTYDPPYLDLGFVVSGISMVSLIIWYILHRKKQNN